MRRRFDAVNVKVIRYFSYTMPNETFQSLFDSDLARTLKNAANFLCFIQIPFLSMSCQTFDSSNYLK